VQGAADAINGLASSPDTKEAVVSARRALDDLSKTLVTLQRQIDPVAGQLKQTLGSLQKTAGQVNSTLAPEGDLRTQLTGTLGHLGEMAESLKRLSEFLERNPNSLIFGRKPPANTATNTTPTNTPARPQVGTSLKRP
jgi:paraquat-inducible protein B